MFALSTAFVSAEGVFSAVFLVFPLQNSIRWLIALTIFFNFIDVCWRLLQG